MRVAPAPRAAAMSREKRRWRDEEEAAEKRAERVEVT